MLAFRPLGRRVINFADPESQKGFVYLPFLLPTSCYPSPSLMGSVSSSSWLAQEYPSFSLCRVSPFIRPSSYYPCLSLCPSPIFSVSTHRNSVRIQRVDTAVQLKSGSDRKLQYSGSCSEKRRPEAGERYRQTLRDRINRMGIEGRGTLSVVQCGSDAREMLCAAFQSHLSRRAISYVDYSRLSCRCKKTR